MQQEESVPSVLEYLSFEADRGLQEPNSDIGQRVHMQGILWKRRDVFRNRWRPRWFVLHSDQRVLTYYILANQEPEQILSGASTPASTRGRSSRSLGSTESSIPSTNVNSTANTIDCDVVPRGTIYLLSSTVEANEALTRPEEDLYTLTIIDHENASHYHLAARTVESRDEWIHRIRLVCQRETRPQHPDEQEPRTRISNRIPFSPQTPMTYGMGKTKTVVARNTDDIDHENLLEMSSEGIFGGKKFALEKEMAVLFAPVFLYQSLLMLSKFRLAAVCFVVTSTLGLRWVLIQHLFTIVQPYVDDHQIGSSSALFPIGHGSICCRFTENLCNISASGSDVLPSHILVSSLAKAIHQQPRLVSKKYILLPLIYSRDIVYLDLNGDSQGQANEIWVTKADGKNLNEIKNYFISAEQKDRSPKTFLQQAFGPACRIIDMPDAKDNGDLHLDLSITDCPITVSVSRVTPTVVSISVKFKSTDTNACRNFVKNFQQSIRSS